VPIRNKIGKGEKMRIIYLVCNIFITRDRSWMPKPMASRKNPHLV
jgi:hypothetical protein